MDFTYDDGNTATTVTNPSRSQQQHDCILSPGEVIHKVKTWHYDYMDHDYPAITYPVRGGIQFFTTEKTCGPYGFTSTDDTQTVEGFTLLTAYGRVGYGFDKIVFVFDRCV